LTLSDFFLAALTIARSFVCGAPRFADACGVRLAIGAFDAAATFRLTVLFAGAATRLALARSTLALALAAGARLETFAPLAAALLAGRTDFWLLAEIFASLLLAEELAFGRPFGRLRRSVG